MQYEKTLERKTFVIEPSLTKREYVSVLRNIKGVWWTDEDDKARESMKRKEKFW